MTSTNAKDAPKRHRPRDPRDPRRRLTIRGTQVEVDAKLKLLRDQAEDKRLGLISAEELQRRVDALASGPLTVDKAWGQHALRFSPRWHRAAASLWRNRIAPWFAGKPLVELSVGEMARWEEEQQGKVSRSTIWLAFSVLRAATRAQAEDGYLVRLPWGRWTPRRPSREKKREACHNAEELSRLLEAARQRDEITEQKTGYADLVYRVAIMTLCCLRQAEAVALAWDWIENLDGDRPDLGNKVMLTVRAQAPDGWRQRRPYRPDELCKGREREGEPDPAIELHPSAIAAFRAQRENLRRKGWYRDDGPVFPSRPRGRYGPGSYRGHSDCIHPTREFKQIWIAAGLPNPERAVPHSLRHTGASFETRMSGGDLKSTAGRTRHASVRTLADAYLHPAERGGTSSAIPPVAIPGADPSAAHRALAGAGPWQLPPGPAGRPILLLPAARSEPEDGPAMPKRSFRAVYAAWVAGGRPSKRPAEITEASERCRSRAYKAEMRRLLLAHEHQTEAADALSPAQVKACRRAGARARAAYLASWARLVRREESPAVAGTQVP
jgi:integrase